jgi:hypothetical protein
VRPPYDIPDRQFDHLTTSDPGAWRRALLLDRMAALAEPLAGLEISPLEHRIVEFLADREVHVVGVLADLLWRAREAAPPAVVTCPRCGCGDVADLGGWLECRGCGRGWAAVDASTEVGSGEPPFDGSHPVRARLVQDVLALLAAHGYRRPDAADSLDDTLPLLNQLAAAFEAGR